MEACIVHICPITRRDLSHKRLCSTSECSRTRSSRKWRRNTVRCSETTTVGIGSKTSMCAFSAIIVTIIAVNFSIPSLSVATSSLSS